MSAEASHSRRAAIALAAPGESRSAQSLDPSTGRCGTSRRELGQERAIELGEPRARSSVGGLRQLREDLNLVAAGAKQQCGARIARDGRGLPAQVEQLELDVGRARDQLQRHRRLPLARQRASPVRPSRRSNRVWHARPAGGGGAGVASSANARPIRCGSACRVTAIAASLTASLWVGWAWQV